MKGLCGNYNDNEADDFQTPSGGITEVSTKIFGNSWKLQAYCPEAEEITVSKDEVNTNSSSCNVIPEIGLQSYLETFAQFVRAIRH